MYKQTQGGDLANKFGEGLTGQQKSNLADKFSNLSKGQRKFLEQADPSIYSPFLKTPSNMLSDQRAALGGIKKGSLGNIPLPKINFPK